MTEKPGVATRLMYQLFVALNRKKVREKDKILKCQKQYIICIDEDVLPCTYIVFYLQPTCLGCNLCDCVSFKFLYINCIPSKGS